MARPPRILLTGPPGCGKTTLILKTLEILNRPAAGFYTIEVREPGGGGRLGFDVVALNGERGPLARVAALGPRVGKYGVDVASFERIGARALEEGLRHPGTILVVDELGKMEFFSSRFVALLPRVFECANPVLGTILYRPHPIADRFRRAPGVEVIQVSAENRDRLPREIALRLSR
ncbi:MAG: AAA family ATPase [Gemmatimonadetes bacterium]|nr:AAA family ATPase [Gemmatimonadota bacterium]